MSVTDSSVLLTQKTNSRRLHLETCLSVWLAFSSHAHLWSAGGVPNQVQSSQQSACQNLCVLLGAFSCECFADIQSELLLSHCWRGKDDWSFSHLEYATLVPLSNCQSATLLSLMVLTFPLTPLCLWVLILQICQHKHIFHYSYKLLYIYYNYWHKLYGMYKQQDIEPLLPTF